MVLFGGVYDWHDPEPLLDAWPEVRRRAPGVRLLFFENPNPETTPQRAWARTRARAETLDPSGREIVFSPWMPYAERADLYAASDLIVSIAAAGLEADLSFRTRLLDAAWGGVPSVSVGGGGARARARGGRGRPARRPRTSRARAGDRRGARLGRRAPGAGARLRGRPELEARRRAPGRLVSIGGEGRGAPPGSFLAGAVAPSPVLPEPLKRSERVPQL